MSFNKIILVGNLGRDPELRYTPSGDAVCSFSIATSEKKKDKSGEFQDVTTWFKVTLWGRQGETASKYLSKGKAVYIEGRLQLEEWTDRDGKERTTLAVRGTDMQFIGSRSDNEGGGYGGNQPEDHDSGFTGAPQASSASTGSGTSSPVATPIGADDDIPF